MYHLLVYPLPMFLVAVIGLLLCQRWQRAGLVMKYALCKKSY
jgi:hypothetical protein